MSNLKSKFKLLLVLDLIIAAFLLLGTYQLSVKSDLPFLLFSADNNLIVQKEFEDIEGLSIGDTLTSIMGYSINSLEEIEMVIDRQSIGDSISLTINNFPNELTVKLKFFYQKSTLLIHVIVVIIFMLLGLSVLYKKIDTEYAVVFHWCCICISSIILLGWGGVGKMPYWVGFITRTGFHTAYALVPAVFIHFTLIFPKEKLVRKKNILLTIYTISILLLLVVSQKFYLALFNYTPFHSSNYLFVLNIIRIFNVAVILISILLFIHSYKTTNDIAEQKKLLWLLLGFAIGPMLYAIFWLMPHWLFGYSFIPESVIIIFMVSVPVSFAISIVKYHLMDISLIINRGVVYIIVIAGLVSVYVAIIVVFASELKLINSPVFSLIIIASITVLFQPLKSKVQLFVDQKFFRVHYNFRTAVNSFTSELEEANNIITIANILVERTNFLIPVTKIGFFQLKMPESRICLISHKNFNILVGRTIKFEIEKLKTQLELPIAVENKVEHSASVELADVKVFERWGMNIVFPVRSSSGIIHGFFVLGSKKSDTIFNVEDIDLLKNVVSTAAISLDRIKLQEEIILEHLENERLEELNKLKSFFVSSVSHDLKTPLTSIKIFTDLLKEKINKNDKKAAEYLEIIEGESDRLKRLINNVLDYTKIENGIKSYKFEKHSLNNVVQDVIKTMHYIFKMKKFQINLLIPEQPCIAMIDRDSIIEALINIISNSLKYSKSRKVISVTVFASGNYNQIVVEDKGIGIPKEKQDQLFEPFFRVESKDNNVGEGAGLGLTIVKHIMDAHDGKIEIESEPEKGTRVILKFTNELSSEKNINN